MNTNRATDYKSKYRYRYLCCVLIAVVMTSLFFVVWEEFVQVNNQTGHLTGKGNLGMVCIIYIIIYCLYMRGLGAHKIGVERKSKLLAAQVMTIFMTNASEVLVSMAVTGQFRFAFIFVFKYLLLSLLQSFVGFFLVIFLVDIYRKIFPPIKILEIKGNFENQLVYKMNLRRDKYIICDSINVDDDWEMMKELIDKYDAVLINDVPSVNKNNILKYCYEIDKRVYFTPKLSDIIVWSSEELNLFDTPLFLNKNQGMSRLQRFNKRTFDIIVSGISMIVLMPIMIVVGIAIKIEDGGPVFYRQERCTRNNKTFMILKFRSMIPDAEKDGKPHPAGEHDDRITKVGRFIRACRIDELPQLWNIFIGQMSIVGPRPERVEHVEMYTKGISEFSLRSKVRGGLTGYAQVYGKYNTTALDKLKMDLLYITNYSFLMDISIIFETVKILVMKESTQGFSDKKKTEMQGDNSTVSTKV